MVSRKAQKRHWRHSGLDPESGNLVEFRIQVVIGVTVLGIFSKTLSYNERNELNQ